MKSGGPAVSGNTSSNTSRNTSSNISSNTSRNTSSNTCACVFKYLAPLSSVGFENGICGSIHWSAITKSQWICCPSQSCQSADGTPFSWTKSK